MTNTFLKLGPTSGCFIYSRTGTSPSYTQVIVQVLHLTHIIDGQLRQDNLEQVQFNRDLERENLGLLGIRTLDLPTCAVLS